MDQIEGKKHTIMTRYKVANPSQGSGVKVAILRLPAFLALACSLCSLFSQTPPVASADPQPFFYPAPPQGFDAVQASDAELAAYGLPPRPPLTDLSYLKWAQAIARAKYRITNPVATATNMIHTPPSRLPAPAGAAAGTEASASWSGVDEVYSYPFFASNNNGYGSVVNGGWAQPTLGSENCTYGPYEMLTWVGMDGNLDAVAGNNDVLQAGFGAQACPTTSYAWYEWYTKGCTVNTASQPCGLYTVNLPVSPGDDVYVTVTYHTSSPNGTAFLEDQTTGKYISIGYNQPPGSPGSAYAGYSAEWVVERPAETLQSPFPVYDLPYYYLPNTPNNWYWLYPNYLNGSSYDPPGLDTSGTFNIINIVCTPQTTNPPYPATWSPTSACQMETYISYAYYWSYYQQPPSGYGTEVLYFFAAGPAKTQ